MRLVVIPPYRGMNWTPVGGHFMLREIVERMQQSGQLKDVEITIDDGQPVAENTTESRDAAVYGDISGGLLRRVHMYGAGDSCDAIICSGGSDIAFQAARVASRIPVVYSFHAALHIASMIGSRSSLVASAYSTVLTCRQQANDYGLNHKLISGRFISWSSTKIAAVVKKRQAGQVEAADMTELIDAIKAQCIEAIEEDRVDSLMLIYPGFQCLEAVIRQKLDDEGYSEIPLICGLPAAVEVAKLLVNLRLAQAARAHPGEHLKAIPRFA